MPTGVKAELYSYCNETVKLESAFTATVCFVVTTCGSLGPHLGAFSYGVPHPQQCDTNELLYSSCNWIKIHINVFVKRSSNFVDHLGVRRLLVASAQLDSVALL